MRDEYAVAALAAVLACTVPRAAAQETEPPELDFLEYLGSIDEDEEWLALAERENDAPRKPAPKAGEGARRPPQPRPPQRDDDERR